MNRNIQSAGKNHQQKINIKSGFKTFALSTLARSGAMSQEVNYMWTPCNGMSQ